MGEESPSTGSRLDLLKGIKRDEQLSLEPSSARRQRISDEGVGRPRAGQASASSSVGPGLASALSSRPTSEPMTLDVPQRFSADAPRRASRLDAALASRATKPSRYLWLQEKVAPATLLSLGFVR